MISRSLNDQFRAARRESQQLAVTPPLDRIDFFGHAGNRHPGLTRMRWPGGRSPTANQHLSV
jgi:hypothetical protein